MYGSFVLLVGLFNFQRQLKTRDSCLGKSLGINQCKYTVVFEALP